MVPGLGMTIFMDLFQASLGSELKPLTELLRPQTVDEVLGQAAIRKDSKLGELIRKGWIPSLILWGPPGTGKTSFAVALSQNTQSYFESVNAIDTGSKALKDLGEQARVRLLQYRQKTILFIDEIHRLNKAQQDVLLPFVERGDLILIGATTENPSYELNKALLSRARVVVFQRLDRTALLNIANKIEGLKGVSLPQVTSEEAIEYLFEYADGDARRFINAWELIFKYQELTHESHLSLIDVKEILQASSRSYDKKSEIHYDVISAFIKSIRGSDPQAAIYYLARMLDGGEDITFVARRLIILASEDVGNADPRALSVAMSAFQACEVIGMPEARIILSQATAYLASCPKSNAAYVAINKALACVEKTGSLEVPLHLRSSQTQVTKNLGYGVDYLYPHQYPKAWVDQAYLPDSLQSEVFYEPSPRGFEKSISEYLNWLKHTRPKSDS